MIYTAPCIMFWMRAYPLQGQVGEGWAMGFESFLGAEMEMPILLQVNWWTDPGTM
jgi:hypothetical protein